MTTSDIIPDKSSQIIEIEKQLAVKRAKIEELDNWARHLKAQANAGAKEAGELRCKANELESELQRIKSAPANVWEDAQMKINEMWCELDGKIEGLVSQVKATRFD